MNAVPPRPGGPIAEFRAADAANDRAAAIALIERHWTSLIFDAGTHLRVFEILGASSAADLAGSPRAGLIAEVVGGLPHGTTRFRLPDGEEEVEQALRSGHARALVEIAILAMIAERVGGRGEAATEIATRSRPLLLATSATRFSPAVELVAYWHLQAAQAALHAGDLERARLDFEHAWAHREDDVTGYVASSTAPFGVLLAALFGDHRELARWQLAWAELSERTAALIEAETMARPALIADLLIAADHLDDSVAAELVEQLEPQLLYDELWPLTLFAIVRHLVDVGAVPRARDLVDTTLDRHPGQTAGRSLRTTFASLADAEVALAEGRLLAVLPLLDQVQPPALPGLDELYAVRAYLAAGDLAGARRHALLAERDAEQPRVLRESRHVLRICDRATGTPTEPARHLEPDLRRLVAHLSPDLHDAARLVSGANVPAPRRSAATHSPLTRLTPAEQRALAALAGPGTLADVAGELHLSRNTLKTQVRSLYRKLDASSRDEMVVLARRHGLLPDG
jgi:LuxR family transcriptional regulator, maltose regulon positive regulatory protein